MRYIFFIAIFLVILIFSLIHWAIPYSIHQNIVSQVKQGCASCKITIRESRINYSPMGLTFAGIHFESGDPTTTAINFDIDRVTAQISVQKLFKKELKINQIDVFSPHVLVTEGDLKTESEPESEKPPDQLSDQQWTFSVDSAAVSEGFFAYKRVFKKNEAILNVKNIKASTEPFGNTPSLAGKPLKATAHGRLEESGQFVLTVEALPQSPKMQIDVDLQIENQNLADLSPFFHNMGNIRIDGNLVSGIGSVHVRGTALKGWVDAKYHGLKIHLEKTKDRGAIATFFSNLISSFAIRSSDLGKKHSEQKKTVEIKRGKDETVVSFILHGLKDAALKVASP